MYITTQLDVHITKDPEHPVTWLNHIEMNQSCEIALNRITKWL